MLMLQFSGLSGSGKTTIATEVKHLLEHSGYTVAVLDGDTYRATFSKDLGFSKADRIENLRRMAKSAAESECSVAILAAINPYAEVREEIRAMYPSKLIWINCCLNILIKRDTKGLYRKALLTDSDRQKISNLTGINDPYEEPRSADVEIRTHELSVKESVGLLYSYIIKLLGGINKTEDSSNDQAYLPQIDCLFLHQFWEYHTHKKHSISASELIDKEDILLGIFGLGKFETYHFLYNLCESFGHFEEWIVNLKGKEFIKLAAVQCNLLLGDISSETEIDSIDQVLTETQLDFWETNGYIRLENVITWTKCDDVITLINTQLEIIPEDEKSWYNQHENLQGMMVQLYQDRALDAIRYDESIRKIFACLYQTNKLLVNCEKVSYNPPETREHKFKGSSLHWDIDFSKGPSYYIQGLVYLHDVPAERGALEVIPGFHHQIEEYLLEFDNPDKAIAGLRESGKAIPVPGKKGDLVLWLQSLPHAATPNKSIQPRYVQYVSFTKL